MGRASVLGAMAMAAIQASCLPIAEPVETLIWEGSLQPDPGAPTLIRGAMTMVAEEGITRMGVGVQGGESGIRLRWEVRDGSCSAPGNLLAPSNTFPEFTLDQAGEGEAQSAIPGRVDDAPAYAGQVFTAGASGGQLLACANMTREP